MNATYINIHTHRRTGEGIEVVSVMAGHGSGETSLQSSGSGGHWPTRWCDPPFSIGIHPWQPCDGFDLGDALREVETAPAAAIGEIGLDHAIPADHGEQKMLFAAQLRIAEERILPVILHCVRAFEPTVEILSAYTLPAVIFHGFIGSPEQAARAIRAGYYLSFGKRSLASPKTVEALRRTPLERLFLETDDAPVHIDEIYARAAEILALPIPNIVTQLYENYERLVGKN